MKNGIVWDASTLDEVWPNAKPYGDYPWVNPDALRTDDRPVTIFDKETGSSTLMTFASTDHVELPRRA